MHRLQWLFWEIFPFSRKRRPLCFVRPGELIIKTHDLAKKWRDDGVTIIGGFHSPIEQECLTILLRGKQPVIICAARSIEGMRLKEEHNKPMSEGRLLILSSSDKKERRITSETSCARNRLVAALADDIIIVHAAPDGKIEKLCKEAQGWDKAIFTIDSAYNQNLPSSGIKLCAI